MSAGSSGRGSWASVAVRFVWKSCHIVALSVVEIIWMNGTPSVFVVFQSP